jgi:hydrophobic/amphiphilic exporter-1 (mainly G- bacteria), HAE1 family
VFVPISFLPSSAGRLFAEFGFVMAIAVALSSFVALSLGPMIASRLPQQTAAGPLWRRLSQWGRSATTAYGRLLATCLRHGVWLLLACLALAAGAAVLYTQLNQELTPTEDRGVLSIRLDGPDGVGLTYSDEQLEKALALVTPLQQQGLVQNIYTITGFYDLNRAYIVAPLADWGQRSVTQAALSARLQRQLDGLPGVRVRIRSGNSLGVGGGDGSVQMAITGDNYTRIAEAAYAFAETIERELPALRDVRVNYAATQPQLTMQVDRQRAAELGVPIAGLDTVLRALVDGTEVAELTVDDRSVPVMLESARRGATQPQDLLALQVRAADGRLVSLAQFVRFDETAIPAELQRLGQRRAVGMSAVTVSGVPLQQAVDGLRALAARELPDGMGLILRGDAATLEQTGRDVNLTFAIALLVVFLVLVAQFEGVSSAAVVLISVPFGLAAAVFAMTLSGTSLNIYTQIGLLLLVGVMAKNSILMVEFADQLRDAGRSVHEAALESARLRLRPIVMTMASTVLGALPLVLGSGPGAESRAAIGWVIFGGLSLAAFFTLFLTPVLYLGLARFSKPRANQGERLAREMQAAADAGAQEIV